MPNRYYLLTFFVAIISSSFQIDAIAQDTESSNQVSRLSSEAPLAPTLFRSSPFLKRDQAVLHFRQKVIERNISSASFNSGTPFSYVSQNLKTSGNNINEQLEAESHINAIAHRYWDTEIESGEWALEYKTEIERTTEGLPERIIETNFSYDEESETVEEEVFITEYEFESNQLPISISNLLNFEGEEVLLGKTLITYSGDPLKLESYTEISFTDFDESGEIIYDTLSTDFVYDNNTVTLELIYGESESSSITVVEGDDLIIEYDETWLEEDPDTGEETPYTEKYRETYPTLGTLIEYFSLFTSIYGQDHTPLTSEYFDEDEEDYFYDYRITTASEGDTTYFNLDLWNENEENWFVYREVKVTFDESGNMAKRDIAYDFEEFTAYYEDLINPAAEFLQFVSVEEEQQIPSTIRLHQNYPNPFNPSTQITFDLQSGGYVQLTVLDIMGREIATLVSQRLQAGSHQVEFLSSGLSSGVYLYRLDVSESGNARVSETRMMTLIK